MPWIKTSNVAMYKGGDWSNYIATIPNCSPTQAQRIALQNPNISFFFYCRDGMELERPGQPSLVFNSGDAVFFKGQSWLGDAVQCDTYQKTGMSIAYIGQGPNMVKNVAETGCYLTAQGLPAIDIVCLFAANINQSPVGNAVRLAPHVSVPSNGTLACGNLDIVQVLQSRVIQNLQKSGITVLLTFLNNWDASGWSQFSSQSDAQTFVDQLQHVVTTYNLDGIDIDDEYSTGTRLSSSLAMVTSLMRAAMPTKIISKVIWEWDDRTHDFDCFRTSYNGGTLGQNLTYSWEMSYGGTPQSRLPSYTPWMPANKLSLGFQSRYPSPTPSNDIAWLKTNGYAGMMVYNFENSNDKNSALLGSLVDDWCGPGTWKKQPNCSSQDFIDGIIDYPLYRGQQLDGIWQVNSNSDGPSVTPNDGYLRYFVNNQQKLNQWSTVAITTPMQTIQGALLTFRIRVNRIQNTSEVKLGLSSGVILRFTNNGENVYWQWYNGSFQTLATSTISADGNWHQVTIAFTPNAISLFENGSFSFNWATTVNSQVNPQFDMQLLDTGGSLSIDIGDIYSIPSVFAPGLNTPWDYAFSANTKPQAMTFQQQSGGPQVSFYNNYARFSAMPQTVTNAWTYLNMQQNAPAQSIIIYRIRVNQADGYETKITLPGNNILRLLNSGSSASWVSWGTGGFQTLAQSSMTASQSNFGVVTLITNPTGISLLENGVYKYTQTYSPAVSVWSPSMAVQHYDQNNVSIDLGGIRTFPSIKTPTLLGSNVETPPEANRPRDIVLPMQGKRSFSTIPTPGFRNLPKNLNTLNNNFLFTQQQTRLPRSKPSVLSFSPEQNFFSTPQDFGLLGSLVEVGKKFIGTFSSGLFAEQRQLGDSKPTGKSTKPTAPLVNSSVESGEKFTGSYSPKLFSGRRQLSHHKLAAKLTPSTTSPLSSFIVSGKKTASTFFPRMFPGQKQFGCKLAGKLVQQTVPLFRRFR